eukprot:6269490-Amphidinium_carterae.1
MTRQEEQGQGCKHRSSRLIHSMEQAKIDFPCAYEATVEMWADRCWMKPHACRLFATKRTSSGAAVQLCLPFLVVGYHHWFDALPL